VTTEFAISSREDATCTPCDTGGSSGIGGRGRHFIPMRTDANRACSSVRPFCGVFGYKTSVSAVGYALRRVAGYARHHGAIGGRYRAVRSVCSELSTTHSRAAATPWVCRTAQWALAEPCTRMTVSVGDVLPCRCPRIRRLIAGAFASLIDAQRRSWPMRQRAIHLRDDTGCAPAAMRSAR
jgi:hypothetical protein